ncbi:rhodanese-like domain-containing protein [Robertkochia sediminum]|uniref:rhodanese-like domain-containing protein n=1 Tax=Robertkochia sediminum TaxID=2785326 RepID=UPI001932E58A|nr:rhodanese-like domain-containing protein [Robertkochia sediminum]MBL7473178.1 rhodanese-like domain-containing protein [Robertkochia sediminum]
MFLDLLRETFFPVHLENIEVLPPETFREHLGKGVPVLLDVRTHGEFEQGHLDGAVNVDIFRSSDFKSYCDTLDREKPVYLYCRSGSRSKTASRILTRMGFKKVCDLRGGILNWK